MTKLVIPEGVLEIGYKEHRGKGIAEVIIPGSVTSIGVAAFANNQLESVTIPNSVTSIGDVAFARNQLKSVTIPDSVTSIGSYAFSSNQLTSVTIPDSVTSIGDGAFLWNSNLVVTCKNGSYAHKYCLEDSIAVNLIEEQNYERRLRKPTEMDKLINFLNSACLHFCHETWRDENDDERTEICIERDNYVYSGAGHFINFIFDQDENFVEINVR